MAWRTPRVAADGEIAGVENSLVAPMQRELQRAANYALAAVAADARVGLLETVGLESEWWTEGGDERASIVVFLPEDVDAAYVARAVDLENLEAWIDAAGRFHAAIGPWYTTKDVDQTVLCIVKVVSQFTGLLDVDPNAHGHLHS